MPLLKKDIECAQAFKSPYHFVLSQFKLKTEPLVQLAPEGISFDWHRPMKSLRQQVPAHIAVQGNLNPEILRTSTSAIDHATDEILSSMKGENGFIFNLGHGVLPDTPVANVQYLVEKLINWKSV